MRLIEGETFAEVYGRLLHELMLRPEHTDTAPRGMKIKEISDLCLIIKDSTSNLFENDVRGIDSRYLAGELLWYFSGRNDLEFISQYSAFWEKIQNADGTLNSAYGYQLWKVENEHGYLEWEWAKMSLLKDKDSRQAIIRFNKPEVSFDGNKDFVCTLAGVFQIRNNKLNLSINMRSSDAILGLTYDIPFFSLLIQAMVFELSKTYPELTAGSLSMVLNSSHIYDRNFGLVEDMLKHGFTPAKLPTYDFDLINRSVEGIRDDLGVGKWNNADHPEQLQPKSKLAEWIAIHC